jgi:hypothetical protein
MPTRTRGGDHGKDTDELGGMRNLAKPGILFDLFLGYCLGWVPLHSATDLGWSQPFPDVEARGAQLYLTNKRLIFKPLSAIP